MTEHRNGAREARWRVHKFGGSTSRNAACMTRVADILEDDARPRVAACCRRAGASPTHVLALVAAAERREPVWPSHLAALRERQRSSPGVLGVAAAEPILADRCDCAEIAGLVATAGVIRSAPASLRDLVVGFGENLVPLGSSAAT